MRTSTLISDPRCSLHRIPMSRIISVHRPTEHANGSCRCDEMFSLSDAKMLPGSRMIDGLKGLSGGTVEHCGGDGGSWASVLGPSICRRDRTGNRLGAPKVDRANSLYTVRHLQSFQTQMCPSSGVICGQLGQLTL
jgi:hypothetical protein